MANVKPVEELVEADVLCIGGGIAGLMAAIKAGELGAKVVVAEKGNALGGGRGCAGNDHFWCYIPEVHGTDMEAFLKECLKGPKLKAIQSGTSIKVLRKFLEKSFEIVKLWDSWGIPMKYHGKWEFAGHSFPGDVLTHLKYEGKWQKRVLIARAIKQRVNIINRVMVLDLLHDGNKVIGAIGMHTRENKIIIFKAKSIIVGTGYTDRLYPSPVPGWMVSSPVMPTLTGDGRAMAYRAGAELVGVEFIRRHPGPRYFARFGQATWIGVLRDPQGKPIGPFVTKPERAYGDMTTEVNSTILDDYLKSGRGPVYMDGRGMSDEDYHYMLHWLVHEGSRAIVDYMKEEKIDVRKHPVEFGTYNPFFEGKIKINEKGETSMKGLYAAGDETTGGISCAATYGWIVGENAARYSKKIASQDIEKARPEIDTVENTITSIKARETGPDWKEANIALQQVMSDYAGITRSDTLLNAGLGYLRKMKKKAHGSIIARNQWEMTRCLETLNLFDLGELVFTAAKERKETRALHKRADYPLTNPLLDDKILCIKKIKGNPVTEWKHMD
jgi:succinate dehydrogenase/fumarate reductase flavoprotein subunit